MARTKIFQMVIALGLLLGFSQEARAHPVKFKGATGVMGTVAPHQIEHEVNHTFSDSMAVGLVQSHLGDGREDRDYIVGSINKRFRRNWLESQGNIYFSLGAGHGRTETSDRFTGYTFVQGDWESRRLYTLVSNKSFFDFDGKPRSLYTGRVGVAPYLASYDQLSTWFIVQGEYRPFRYDDEWMIGPVVRFYWRNYLLEVGASTEGDVGVTYMVSF